MNAGTEDVSVDSEYDLLTEEISQHLEETKAVILQGPPGTGKTYHARQVVEKFAKDGESYRWNETESHADNESSGTTISNSSSNVIWDLVQFHSNYSYEDFVRGIRINTTDNGVSFVKRDGLLVELAEVARRYNETKVVLILDEINRGNVGSILGEAILAIDGHKRGEQWPVRLKYDSPRDGSSGRSLALPENLYIIGTMNTADESVALIDHAIRRRFRFIDVRPDMSALTKMHRGKLKPADQRMVMDCYQHFQEEVFSELPTDYQPGHTLFKINDSNDVAESLKQQLRHELVPTLLEYDEQGIAKFDEKELKEEIERGVEKENDRGVYIASHDFNRNEDLTRNPIGWLQYGFIAGGNNGPWNGRTTFEQVHNCGQEGELVIMHGDSKNDTQWGASAIGEICSNRAYLVNKDTKNLQTEICDYNKEYLNDKVSRDIYDPKEHHEAAIDVEWKFVLPGIDVTGDSEFDHNGKIVKTRSIHLDNKHRSTLENKALSSYEPPRQECDH